MSTLGTSPLPAVSIAQSLATSQRPDSAKTKADAATAAAQHRQTTATAPSTKDVADVGSSSDRDPDGRRLDAETPDGSPPESAAAPSPPAKRPRRKLPPDPTGRLGRQLDVET